MIATLQQNSTNDDRYFTTKILQMMIATLH